MSVGTHIMSLYSDIPSGRTEKTEGKEREAERDNGTWRCTWRKRQTTTATHRGLPSTDICFLIISTMKWRYRHGMYNGTFIILEGVAYIEADRQVTCRL